MPWKARIQTTFNDLFRSLGMPLPPGRDVGFDLTSNVVPSVIVGQSGSLSTISVTGIFTQPIGGGGGSIAAPAIGTTLASLNLSRGSWLILAFLSTFDPAVAANCRLLQNQTAGILWIQHFYAAIGVGLNIFGQFGLVAEDGDSIQIQNVPAGGVGSIYSATIFGQKLPVSL